MACTRTSPLSELSHSKCSFSSPSSAMYIKKFGYIPSFNHTLSPGRNVETPCPSARYSAHTLKCVALAAVQEYRDTSKVDRIRTADPDRRQVYTVQIRKPLGIVFREDRDEGRIVVDELVAGGNAFQSITPISVGDSLMATTAEALQSGTSKTQTIMFKTDGEDFDTVIKAIQSNTCARCLITMVMERGGPIRG